MNHIKVEANQYFTTCFILLSRSSRLQMERLWCPHYHYGGHRFWLSPAVQGKLHTTSPDSVSLLTLFSQLMFHKICSIYYALHPKICQYCLSLILHLNWWALQVHQFMMNYGARIEGASAVCNITLVLLLKLPCFTSKHDLI